MFPIAAHLQGIEAMGRDRNRAKTVLVVTALSVLWATLFASGLL